MTRSRLSLLALTLTVLAAGCGSSTSTQTHSRTSTAPPATSTTPSAHTGPTVTKLHGTTGRKGSLVTLEKLPRLQRPSVRPRLTGFPSGTLPEKLTAYANDVAYAFNFAFQHYGPTNLPPASLAIIDQTPAQCGSIQVTTTSPPRYCPATTSLELPLGTLNTQIAPLGDAALLLVVADLYGYHIENALGLLNSLSPSALETTDSCLAGVYFAYASGSKYVQPGDEDSVNKLLALEGAPTSSGSGAGQVTPSGLTAAFNKGIMGNGDFHVCVPASGQ